MTIEGKLLTLHSQYHKDSPVKGMNASYIVLYQPIAFVIYKFFTCEGVHCSRLNIVFLRTGDISAATANMNIVIIPLGMNVYSTPRFLFRFCDCKKKVLHGVQFRKNLCHSQFAMENRPIEKSIHDKLEYHFNPIHLKIINESFMHNVPRGSETHFKVFVVSQEFENMPLLKRHRLVNSVLEEELKNGVHALSIVAKAPSQWNQNEEVEGSPKCLGGFGK